MGSPLQAHLSGAFNLSNILAGISFARTIGVSPEVIRRALEKFHGIRGRVERINMGQIRYHCRLRSHHRLSGKMYEVFRTRENLRTRWHGGGRDSWKRPAMGQLLQHIVMK